MEDGKKALFTRLPSDVFDAFKFYCTLHGRKQSEVLEEVLLQFLRSAGALKPEADVHEAALKQFMEKVLGSGETKDAYEKKKRQLNEARAERIRAFHQLRESIGGEVFEAVRKYGRECGLKPDPGDPAAPLLESIRPAIRAMLENYQPQKYRFTYSHLSNYVDFLENWVKEHELRREVEQMRRQNTYTSVDTHVLKQY